jgi:hypothetical protein
MWADEPAEISPALAAALDPDLVADWEEAGGVEHRLGTARRVAGQIVGSLGDDKVRFLSGFDGLPDAAQSAIFAELALEPDASVTSAPDRDVARFASTEEGTQLVAAWGRGAARNVALLRTRLGRIISRAQADGVVDALEQWFDTLTPDAAAAVYRALVR